MDETLDRAWRDGTPPFDGLTLRVEPAPVRSLAPLLSELAANLRRRFGERRLWCVEDWHAHDGWVSGRKASSWDSLVELCRSTEALVAQAALDELVALAFYTEPPGLLLRIEVEETPEPDRERQATFDLTLPSAEVPRVEASLRELGLERGPAKAYFDGIHAG